MALSEIERETYNSQIAELEGKARAYGGAAGKKSASRAAGFRSQADALRAQFEEAERSGSASPEISRRATETLARSAQIKAQNVLKEDNDRVEAGVRLSQALRQTKQTAGKTAAERYQQVEQSRQPQQQVRLQNLQGFLPVQGRGYSLQQVRAVNPAYQPPVGADFRAFTSPRFPTSSREGAAQALLRQRTRERYSLGLRPDLPAPNYLAAQVPTEGVSINDKNSVVLFARRSKRSVLKSNVSGMQNEQNKNVQQNLESDRVKLEGDYEGKELFGIKLRKQPRLEQPSQITTPPKPRRKTIDFFGTPDRLYNPYAPPPSELRRQTREKDVFLGRIFKVPTRITNRNW